MTEFDDHDGFDEYDGLDDALGFDDHDDLAAELLELRALGRAVGTDPVDWDAPPAGLWDRIAAAAAADDTADDNAAAEQPTYQTATEQPASERPVTHDAPVAPVVPLTRRRPAPLVWLAAAAAAVVLVVAVAVTRTDRTDRDLVASVALERLGTAGTGAAGAAQLERVGDHLVLQVDTENLDPGDGFLELWVIDPDVTKLISLGPLRRDGRYDLPPGFDPEAYPVVDVSVEPKDGDPTHSGDSVLRGVLTF